MLAIAQTGDAVIAQVPDSWSGNASVVAQDDLSASATALRLLVPGG